jgi:hypothetical protein
MMTTCADRARQRTVVMVSTPAFWPVWPAWPFLPVVRRTSGGEHLGVVFDARHARGLTGYSATVFDCNLFMLPRTWSELLGLPREVYDSAEELADAGWRVD